MIKWVSIANKEGNVGCILLEGDDILIIDIPDQLHREAGKDVERIPKNVFLSKNEMSKYTNLEKY